MFVFNFKKSLLDYGFKEELVDEWMVIRNKKKAVNSEFALKLFLSQVQITGRDKNEILKIVAPITPILPLKYFSSTKLRQ